MEHLLHYVWKHKLFSLEILQTTKGLPVEVIDPGLRNPNSGPDFFNAKLKINNTLWVGNVEIHTRSSDWFRHGHDGDKVYDSVILHIVGEADGEVTRTNGEVIPQMIVSCPERIKMHYYELCVSDCYPACYPILRSLPKLTVHSWLSALQTERLEQKAKLIGARLEHCNNNWEDVFFITLARNYGFGLNGDAFEAWAELLPFRALDKHRNDLFQIEALFYGMDATLWRFLRLRPDNFPHIRLAQLAYLYQKGDKLFSRLLEAKTLAEVRILLSTRTSVYWENHYIFGRTSPQREKLLGEQSKDLIIINTVVPFLYTYGLHKADEGMCERAGRFLEKLKAENNHIIRSWSDAGLPVASAADSQALIQLQKEYCDKRKCLYCRFGYEYLRKK